MSARAAIVLACAADMLDRPGAWTQGATARDEHGEELHRAADDAATCHCGAGALHAAAAANFGSENDAAFGEAAIAAAAHAGQAAAEAEDAIEWLVEWNDVPG